MSTSIDFRKMHGLGNDFVVVDARQQAFVPTANQAKHIADRRWGVGCDQLIVLEPSTRADVFMRIYNSDGSQAEACGNATRCIAGLLSNEGASQPSIETLRGVLAVEPASDNRFRIDMGPPIFDPALIPVTAASHKSLPVLLPNFPAPIAVSMETHIACSQAMSPALKPLTLPPWDGKSKQTASSPRAPTSNLLPQWDLRKFDNVSLSVALASPARVVRVPVPAL